MIFMPKRSNPNSMIFMPKRDTIYMPRPNGMIMGKRGGPNSMIFMPKRFNPNSMILLPKRSNPNSMIFMPKRADDVAKRETDLDEFFTSRGKKSWLMPVSIIIIVQSCEQVTNCYTFVRGKRIQYFNSRFAETNVSKHYQLVKR